jgi:molybdopterin molybdotransferase
MKISKQVQDLTVENALKKVLTATDIRMNTETVSVSGSLNRITAEEIIARRDIPRFNNSAMDGYLFLTKDLNSGRRTFSVTGEIRPEHEKPDTLKTGTASRIMTGAPVPAGEYTVVPVEQAQEKERQVTVNAIPDRNPIRKQGEGYKTGKPVLEKGALIRPYEIGLLIESGNRSCELLKPLRIAIQVTGSEIDEETDSNGPVLEALCEAWPGTVVKRWPVLDDDPEKVTVRMKELNESSDIVLTTGGISAGRHDYILQSMLELGSEILVHKVQQKPGKPFTVSQQDGVPFFHLPGNPVSAVFTAEYYVKRRVLSALGLNAESLKAVIMNNIENHRGGKTLFLTGKLSFDDQNRLTITTERSMRSHLMQLYHGNHAYVKIPPETAFEPGDRVEISPFGFAYQS